MRADPMPQPAPAFRALLTQYRKRSRLGVTQLGMRADLDSSYVSRLESGSRVPGLETVLMLAGTLGLTPIETATLVRAAGFWPPDPVGAAIVAITEALAETPLSAAHRSLIVLTLTSLMEGQR